MRRILLLVVVLAGLTLACGHAAAPPPQATQGYGQCIRFGDGTEWRGAMDCGTPQHPWQYQNLQP